MPIEILMPALSPTMTEGTLAKWHKKEGDAVAAGDVLAEIETDKATMEVEAVDEGTLGKILVKDGADNVPVNKVIALLLEEGEDKKALKDYTPAEPTPAEETPAETPSAASDATAPAVAAVPQAAALAPQATKAPEAPKATDSARVKASPLARRMAESSGIALGRITGTGPHGRIVKADVEAAITGIGGAIHRNPVEFVQLPNNNMRKTIARRLTESKQQVPHFYLTIDLVLDALLDARKALNGNAPTTEDNAPSFKLSVNDFIIKAVALGLRDIPEANVSWYDDARIRYNNVDVSVAVATEGGLITPIIKNADQKTLPAISAEMKSLAARARDGKLAPEEYEGGGFSLSNLGMYGIKEFAAIINPPQACILAVGQGEERAMVRAGQLATATMMSATLAVDHRAVDGALGAQFLAAFKKYIEHPVLMLT